MREIKFRSWDKQDKEIDSWECILDDGFESYLNDRFEILQFTGLKDKNGKEIYEGDIAKNESGIIAPIEFNNGAFWFGCVLLFDVFNELEIIGNVLENHMLLEKMS